MIKHLSAACIAAAILVSSSTTLDGQRPASDQARATSTTIIARDGAALRQWDTWLRSRESDRAIRLGERVTDDVLAGREHERLHQFHRGVRVFGAGVARQWRNGQLESMFGRVYEILSIDVTPALSASEAAARAGCTRARAGELMIYVGNSAPALTWRVPCYRPGEWSHVFVNASTGAVETRLNRIHTQAAVGEGRGVFFDVKKMSVTRQGSLFVAEDVLRPPRLWTLDLRGNVARAVDLLNGETDYRPSDIASDDDNSWTDGAIVDAHTYVGWTYDYVFKRFGRRGLDGQDAPLVSLVHPVTQTDALTLPPELMFFATNAFWCSGCGPDGRGAMVFGDGIPPNYFVETGQTITYFAASLDIAAHELAHGLTDYTSGLIYRDESGALNEAFSDIIGTSTEFFFQRPGVAIGQADYLIGEDSITALADGINGIRSMAVPSAFGDPDHYSERYVGDEDDGGVHINSAIVNHAFYLAIEGGTHRLSGVTVPGVGAQHREQIERVFFRAFTMFLPPNATFAIARGATIQAARDLYGPGSAPERAIAMAWTAVGVE
jgi:thermolysin